MARCNNALFIIWVTLAEGRHAELIEEEQTWGGVFPSPSPPWASAGSTRGLQLDAEPGSLILPRCFRRLSTLWAKKPGLESFCNNLVNCALILSLLETTGAQLTNLLQTFWVSFFCLTVYIVYTIHISGVTVVTTFDSAQDNGCKFISTSFYVNHQSRSERIPGQSDVFAPFWISVTRDETTGFENLCLTDKIKGTRTRGRHRATYPDSVCRSK